METTFLASEIYHADHVADSYLCARCHVVLSEGVPQKFLRADPAMVDVPRLIPRIIMGRGR